MLSECCCHAQMDKQDLQQKLIWDSVLRKNKKYSVGPIQNYVIIVYLHTDIHTVDIRVHLPTHLLVYRHNLVRSLIQHLYIKKKLLFSHVTGCQKMLFFHVLKWKWCHYHNKCTTCQMRSLRCHPLSVVIPRGHVCIVQHLEIAWIFCDVQY